MKFTEGEFSMGGGGPVAPIQKAIKKTAKVLQKPETLVKDDPLKTIGAIMPITNPNIASVGVPAAALARGTVNQFEDMNAMKKKAIEAADESAKAQKEAVDDQRKVVEDQKKAIAKEEATAADEEAAMAAGETRDSARARQRKLSLGARGRRSTILTSNYEDGPTRRKTLLGQ